MLHCRSLRVLLKSLGVIIVGGFTTSVYWTLRSWIWGCPVRCEYSLLWQTGDANDRQLYVRQKTRFIRVWTFLRPFFASKGYHLFLPEDPNDIFAVLRPVTPPAQEQNVFPFAQSYGCDSAFHFIAPRVWPARDSRGREVIIKAISGPHATRELQALRKLNSAELRQHPCNHTIPLLDILIFDGDAFAVMPRWGSAGNTAFATVGEIVRYGQAFLEAVHFLHSHGFAHGDITAQNMVMDAVCAEGPTLHYYGGLRGPERRYALIDFETAVLIDGVAVCDSLEDGPALAAAYCQDLDQLAKALEITLRCAQDMLPGLEVLLDGMKLPNSTATAGVALARFETIWKRLPAATLNSRVEAIRYRNELCVNALFELCQPQYLDAVPFDSESGVPPPS